MQKDIKNRQVLGLLPKWFSSFIFTFAMWECADQQQLQLKSLKGLRVKHSLRNHYATQKSSLVCLCLRVAVKGQLLHTSWIKLFWEYRTLTSAIAHILPSCLFFSWGLSRKKKHNKKINEARQRKWVCESLRYVSGKSVSPSWLQCGDQCQQWPPRLWKPNLLYTWDCLQPSALLLQSGTEIIKYKLQGWRAHKHSCHCVTTCARAKQYLNADEFN